MRSPLRVLALGSHALLLAALGAATFSGTTRGPALVGLAAILPLLATLPGLMRRQRGVEQWLAVLLVLYVGAMSVEVVASAGAAWLASVALLSAAVELGALLALIRRSPRRSPAVRE